MANVPIFQLPKEGDWTLLRQIIAQQKNEYENHSWPDFSDLVLNSSLNNTDTFPVNTAGVSTKATIQTLSDKVYDNMSGLTEATSIGDNDIFAMIVSSNRSKVKASTVAQYTFAEISDLTESTSPAHTDVFPMRVGTDSRKVSLNTLSDTLLLVANMKQKIGITPEGGIALKLTNRTGSNSVKGTIVIASASYDSAFAVSASDENMAIGAVYENGIADGSACWVVISGVAEVLLKDGVAGTRGYICYCSATAGRMDQASTVPADAVHFREIGHCIEAKSSGTDVLAKIVMHFN